MKCVHLKNQTAVDLSNTYLEVDCTYDYRANSLANWLLVRYKNS